MKSKLLIAAAALALVVGAFAGMAGATNTGNGTVDFTVVQALELTAYNISMGPVAPGANGPRIENPVKVSSNVDWQVLAYGTNFSDAGNTVSLSIAALRMGSVYLDNSAAQRITDGPAGLNREPDVETTLDIPWSPTELVGKTLSGTVTYTAVPW
jgi:hypothetical protein